MMKILTTLTLITLIIFNLKAQPDLKGEIEADYKTGVIKANLFITNLPDIKDYKVVLNKGLNIKYFKDSANNRIAYKDNGTARNEGMEYFFTKDGNQTDLPKSFKIEYVSAFPVYSDTLNLFDFKGFIADNGKTFRAAEQSKCYPIIYDIKNDRLIESYTL